MPRIIFKCRYLKNAAAHLSNFVEYVATRDGVEKIANDARPLPATEKQRQLIAEIVRQFPDTVELFEYEDYLDKPSIENASEFITMALEQNLDRIDTRANYVDYIANRPRVEKLGTHGLFADAGAPVVLSHTAEEIANHTGNVWTNIVSLRREDASRLGYDNAKAWMDLIRGQRNMLAAQMKIQPDNFHWHAAFHNEGHHPHIHLIAYSADPREAYVTKKAIENMRGGLARAIFKQDLIQIYSEQTVRRDALTQQSREALLEIIGSMSGGVCKNKTIEDLLVYLAERLRHTSGRKQYGYLKAPLKSVVDQIVDELAKDERVALAYEKWYELRNEVLRTYTDKLPPPLPLSKQQEFKAIKNMVIAEAMNIGGHRFTFEGDENAEPLFNEETGAEEAAPDQPAAEQEAMPPAWPEDSGDIPSATPENSSRPDSGAAASDETRPHIAWSGRYKEARVFLYGSDDAEPDFGQALSLFTEEAETGNALAMHDLGRMHADGLTGEPGSAAAFTWYDKALAAFLAIESEKESPYVEYQIGKMFAAGLGAEQDYVEAANWFDLAASQNHKYAQYSLAGLFYHGRGVEQDYETAFSLYRKSARQHVPYADYELAKMYRDGVGTEKDAAKANRHFREAFAGFQKLEAQGGDDKLQYRLGWMLYTGTGTEQDTAAAIDYFEKSAHLGNVHAQYMLGKIYLDVDSGHENIEQALRWLSKSADNGHDGAQYALGKLYLAGCDIPKDVEAAVRWLTSSAEQGNQYAQYALGKLYLMGREVPRDREAAHRWFTLSAEQGNVYAQFFLDHWDSYRDPSAFLAVTRLLHHLSRIFREEQRRLGGGPDMQVDSKLLRKLRRKKMAQGHAPDDHAPKQIQ
ncbi:hypothetical protein SDC9_74890 [bioreactor metagenome]|uniref:Secretory immunoglobulin A-binding protein EsiB n=1 Tax=bioreactor metagenome TaxID=1076179 RepID=A0A644YK35_9ZZZZ